MLEQLGPDPAKVLMKGTGEWALRGLALVLLATPVAKFGWPSLFRYRRMLGLCVFLYVSLHLLLFAQVYVGWSATLLLEELQDLHTLSTYQMLSYKVHSQVLRLRLKLRNQV